MSFTAVSDQARARARASSRPVPWRLRLGLAVLGIALALLVGELALRVLGPRLRAVHSLVSIASFQTYHPVYGFFHRPGASGWIETAEFSSFVEISAQGLRDRAFTVPKPPGTFRILMLGDSFVEGAQVPVEATISRQLEAMLQARSDRPIEVVNAGNAGFGTGQEVLYLEHDGASFEPDLVVLVFFVDNDLADNGLAASRARDLDTSRRPFFVPDDHGGLELRPFTAPPVDPLGGPKTALRRASLLYNLIENFLLWHEARDQENQQIGKNRPTYLIEPTDEWAEAWLVTERLLARAERSARQQGAEFLLVVAPSNYQVSPEAWRWLVAGTQDRGRRYDPDAPNRRLAEIVARTGVRALDLLPKVRAAAASGPPLYYPEDGHWTAAGHHVGARELASYLEENGLLPSR